ncbi:hypothetical protein GCM10023194_17420 [Planotetraspora phitsanulokensis]|uniref:Uncharacterized protein n=1 Tax=Planotetraspora phitsanulokensis TaxID=575192 RepID=A0A8J3XG21_9ACTN|nr:hypothetical protein [Planotetraspora phitsanulokensis]GII35103.1 hypothetical protein Pph01_01060 [Planotetraspora phitsanulokensis]
MTSACGAGGRRFDSSQRRWPDYDHYEIVAATLIQHPRYVDVADERWDENAQFIAEARHEVPRLIAEIRRLRELLATADQDLGTA